jgi:hypothetical protein
MKRRLVRLMAAALAACSLTIEPASAQTTSGQISGRVVDPDRQAIPGAEVTLTNQLTKEQRVQNTETSGDFVFASVQPGTFSITVTAPAFKTLTKQDLMLTASDRLSAGTLQMEIGALSDEVTVHADITPVQTVSGERSALLDDKQIANLLNPARNFMNLTRILPGVVATNNVGTDQLGIFGIDTVNGVRSEYNTATVDGVIANTRGRDQIETPLNMDAVAEVKILQNNYQAEYGGSSGSSINAVTKSGTQTLHGALYYYNRNEAYNANTFFNNKLGLPKPINRFNTIGYNAGGPVILPWLHFNRTRDKVFFFFSQEIWPTVHPADSDLQITVPTAAERNGDFSHSIDNTGKPIFIADPQRIAAGATCKKAGDAGCFPGNIIPANLINTDMQKLLNLLPLPNFDVTASHNKFNYQLPLSEKNPVNQRILRLDFNISSKWRAYFRGLDMNVKSQGPGATSLPMIWLTSFPVDYNNRSPNVTADFTYIASPTLVNELNVGWAGWSEEQVYPNGSNELSLVQKSALGLTVGQFRPQLNPLGLIPSIVLGGGTLSNLPTIGFGGRFPISSQTSSYGVTDGLTKVWRGHTSKAGVYIHFDRLLQHHNSLNFSGRYDFTVDANNPLDSSNTYVNALLGNFRQYAEGTSAPDYDPRTRIFDWYVQDNWKAKRVSLDYGVRFTKDLPQTLQTGANFSPAAYNPALAPVLYQPVLVGGIKMGRDPRTGATVPAPLIGAVVPGSGDPFDGLVTLNDQNPIRSQGLLAAPRLGFAWNVFGDGKTAIRGGTGVFYNSRPPSSQAGDLTTNPPVLENPTHPFGNINQLFATSDTGYIFPSNLTRALDENGKRPVFYNSSLGIQQSIGFQMVLDVAYVGTQGRHLGQTIDLNALPPGTRFLSTSQDPTSPSNRPVPLADNFLRRYIGLGSIPFTQFAGTSSYNALQTQVTRRFSRGLGFGVNYTWSRAKDYGDTTASTVAQYAPIQAYSYGLAGFDREHALKINWLWSIPNASHLWNSTVIRVVLDNWQLSGIASFISGTPLGINLNTGGFDLTGGGDPARVVLTGDPTLAPGDRTVDRFINTGVVTAPARNTIGGNGQYSTFVGNAGRVVFRGPGTNNWDMALFKNVPVTDRVTFQLRCEFYNIFNHPSFTGVDTTAQFRYDAAGNPGKQQSDTFGQVNGELGPRQIQLAGRITF